MDIYQMFGPFKNVASTEKLSLILSEIPWAYKFLWEPKKTASATLNSQAALSALHKFSSAELQNTTSYAMETKVGGCIL